MKKKRKIHCLYVLFVLSCCCLTIGYAQNGLTLPKAEKSDKIDFELVNNLVIIPVEVNGAKLSFLLDSGVNSTILFGITEADSLLVNNAKPIKVRGFGEGLGVEALESKNNQVKVGDAIDENHSIYVIFEETLNFSARMGIPIHGIIGYDFFSQFVVKTDYIRKKLTFYKPDNYKWKKCRECEEFELMFDKNKPYITIQVSPRSTILKQVVLLIDSGSSDALWLFEKEGFLTEDKTKYFDDFLGLGFSGNIFGKRSKLDEIWMGSFNLKEVKVAFPSDLAMDGINIYKERDGSLGGDLLKRFTVIMDYKSGKMMLRKNSNYNEPFYYNMAGLTIEHDGLEVVTELTTHRNFNFGKSSNSGNGTASQAVTDVSVFTEIALVPRYVVVEVREGSPAYLAGVRVGDEVATINGVQAYKMKLFTLNTLFSSKVGKKISLNIVRNGQLIKTKFVLKKVI